MELLLHICCANCALYPVTTLKDKGINVHGHWYNPNIHPHTEYIARLDALRQLQELWGLHIDYKDNYGLDEYIRAVGGNMENRCLHCYSLRLEETAIRAKEIGMDAFSTTLLVSPYQKTDMIKEIGMELEERYNIEFLPGDFREGWHDGKRLLRELGLYRQKYCGCIYSLIERQNEKKNEKETGKP